MGKKMKGYLNHPIILTEGNYSESDLEKLKNENKIWNINDIYISQLEELFEILNPNLIHSEDHSKKLKEFISSKTGTNYGNWIYFPWNGNLVHAVREKDYFALRTNRNQLVINENEQAKLYSACIGFVGLSIGSHFAIGMSYAGIAKKKKLVEFDKISTSNLNRLKASISDVNTPKIEYASRQIYQIDPYSDLELFANGLKEESFNNFFGGERLDLIFEAIDDFEMKIKLRLKAKEQKVPVVMLTNLGDSLLVDVERYDLDKDLDLFNGLIGDTPEEILNSEITEQKKVEYAVRIVGREHLSPRILESLYQINKTLVGRPQIFSTVSVAGGFAAYLAKKLILREDLKSGRYYIDFDNIINKNS